VIGSLIATFDGWRGEMYRLAVDPDYRRMGLASGLVGEGERLLAGQGCRRITALVLTDEDPATTFWRAVDYQLDRRIVRFVKTIQPAPD
jgi:ribosomal protein S18 acetylase RimI-like enzyme